jgi:hypothetical protein
MMIGKLGLSLVAAAQAKPALPNNFSLKHNIRGFDYSHKCVLDDFPFELETGEITKTLCSVGFASPPDWLKSYDCLIAKGKK